MNKDIKIVPEKTTGEVLRDGLKKYFALSEEDKKALFLEIEGALVKEGVKRPPERKDYLATICLLLMETGVSKEQALELLAKHLKEELDNLNK